MPCVARVGADRERQLLAAQLDHGISAGERVQRALEESEVWVAERASRAVGWVEIARDRIEGLYVRPDASGAGIGSALLLHAEAVIRSAGHRAVALDASWNAEPFYLRRGYHALAERPDDSGRPMRKPLCSALQVGVRRVPDR
jgi:GNAT superfamily N-acetyltransferase